MLISLVYITKEIINFSKDIILFNEYQIEALVRQERMLYPVVKVSSIQQGTDTGSSGIQAIISTATGFSIEYDAANNTSLIITNDHFCRDIGVGSMLILENYEKAIADASSEYIDEYIESKILYTDPQLDLCLVKAAGYIPPAIIADYSYEPKLFEKVFIVGGPTGNFPIIIDTYISSIVQREEIGLIFLGENGNDFILISEQIFPGHSGSPVFNQRGEVIGVVFASLETYGGLTISHKDIFELLSDYKDSI
jgi:S1-C subfamily serine protease